jgi:hypothetical protein
LAVLVIAGLGGVAGGALGLHAELARHATAAEAAAAGRQELASRWLRLTAGQIFPRTVGYSSSATGQRWSSPPVGASPRASCAAATDPAVAAVLARSHCRAVLRATYADASGTLVATAGIAVMPSRAAASAATEAIPIQPDAGVRAVSFPGTAAGLFRDAQRVAFAQQEQGPYVLFYAAGFADGRVTRAGAGDPALGDLGGGIVDSLAAAFGPAGNPCREKDVRC